MRCGEVYHLLGFHTGAIVREKSREWLAVSRGSRQKVEAVTWEEVEVEAAHNAECPLGGSGGPDCLFSPWIHCFRLCGWNPF